MLCRGFGDPGKTGHLKKYFKKGVPYIYQLRTTTITKFVRENLAVMTMATADEYSTRNPNIIKTFVIDLIDAKAKEG